MILENELCGNSASSIPSILADAHNHFCCWITLNLHMLYGTIPYSFVRILFFYFNWHFSFLQVLESKLYVIVHYGSLKFFRFEPVVSDGRWHVIVFNRVGDKISLRLDQTEDQYTYNLVSVLCDIHSFINFVFNFLPLICVLWWKLTCWPPHIIRFLLSLFKLWLVQEDPVSFPYKYAYLGKAPPAEWRNVMRMTKSRAPFDGCLQQVKFNGHDLISLVGSANIFTNARQGCKFQVRSQHFWLHPFYYSR